MTHVSKDRDYRAASFDPVAGKVIEVSTVGSN